MIKIQHKQTGEIREISRHLWQISEEYNRIRFLWKILDEGDPVKVIEINSTTEEHKEIGIFDRDHAERMIRADSMHYYYQELESSFILQKTNENLKNDIAKENLTVNINIMTKNPTAFISYAWESDEVKNWVKKMATELRSLDIDVKLDLWEVAPGDQLPHFMEKSVRENDFVLIICTPKYKDKSDNRSGGVGYEGDIMTAEVLSTSNHRKFIPILKSGTKETALPSWLKGRYYVDLSSEQYYLLNFEDIVNTLLNRREEKPKLGVIKPTANSNIETSTKQVIEDDTIKIKGILIDEITEPKNDGTAGSGLYKIPFELNKTPSYEWIELFINAWNRPTRFTSMHRPGIASVSSNKIILDGTEIEEVEKFHKDTLKLAVEIANNFISENKKNRQLKEESERKAAEEHKNRINDISKRISFDD